MNLDVDSVVSVEDFAVHTKGKPADDEWMTRAVAAINAATAFVRAATGRTLRRVVHRDPVVIADLDVTALNVTINGVEATQAIATVGAFRDAGIMADDVVATSAHDPGVVSRVVSVLSSPSADIVSFSPPLAALPDDTFLATFGRRALRAIGDGSDTVLCPEWPVASVISAAYIEAGQRVAVDTSDWFLPYDGAMITFPRAYFPADAPVVLEVLAGYAGPTLGASPDVEWIELRRLWLRAAEVYFLDDSALRGRRTSGLVVGDAGTFTEAPMPTDVMAWVDRFVRRT